MGIHDMILNTESTHDRVDSLPASAKEKGGGADEYIRSDNFVVPIWNVSDSFADLHR